MTTRIKITNAGPENAGLFYYDQTRQFKQHKDILLVGDTIEVDIWDGHIPVLIPLGHDEKTCPECGHKFYAVPPAHY